MTHPDYARELAVALDLAAQAAQVIAAVYATGDFAVDQKADGSPVTVADQRADALIVAGLRAAFPGDGVLSEEAPFTDPPDSRRLWMVDPLDGTRDFAHRTGDFAVMIGLCVEQRPVLGVVAAPHLQRTWAGVVGQGAFELGADGARVPLRVGPPAPVPRVLTSRSHPATTTPAVLAPLGPHTLIGRGSVGLKVGLMVAGEADLYAYPGTGTSLWDCCGPQAIMEAAGGHFSTARGEPVRYDQPTQTRNLAGILAGHPALVARCLSGMG